MMGFGFLGLLVVIGLITWMTQQEAPGRGRSPRNENELPPLEILDRRYARGEITREEYQNIKQDLA